LEECSQVSDERKEIRVLDLFSGIGGFSLGLKRAGGFRTVAYCEIEPYCQAVLLARMRDGWLDTAPIHSDITRLDGKPWRGRVDAITGGFPCQDISWAGQGGGLRGERSGLWREIFRLICEIRPSLVVVENGSALLFRGLDGVLSDLAEGGYDAEWSMLRARDFGAPHKRDRVYLVAYPNKGNGEAGMGPFPNGTRPIFKAGDRVSFPIWLQAADQFIGMDDGLPAGIYESRGGCVGNAVAPQVVEWIGRRINAVNCPGIRNEEERL
jgi:DNA (cytosine-5)-methyltransferase 1